MKKELGTCNFSTGRWAQIQEDHWGCASQLGLAGKKSKQPTKQPTNQPIK